MPEFDWTDQDPMEGLDTDLTPEEQAFQEPIRPAPQTPQQLARRAAQVHQQVTQPVLPQLPVTYPPPEVADEDALSEVEIRLAKAQCYKAILGSQLLEGDDPISVEVEMELQDWAHRRLEELMGVRSLEAAPNMSKIEELVKSLPQMPFSEEEVTALKALASRILSPAKPATPSTPPSVKPVQAKPVASGATPAAKPVAESPSAARPAIKPAVAAVPIKRGRGRPRKTPCQKCGQMLCVCRAQSSNLPTNAPSPTPPKTDEQIEVLSDGTKIKTVGSKRYKVVQREVVDKRTGGTRVIEVDMDITPTPKLPTAAPYPGEMAVAQLAAMEAEKNTKGAMSNPKIAQAIQATLKLGE